VYGLVRSGQVGSSSQKYVGSLGHESDANTGLIYMRARYMDPVLGRFLSEDPGRDGANWFVYCGSNPINKVDTDGRTSCSMDDISCAEWLLAIGKGFTLTALYGLTLAAIACDIQFWKSNCRTWGGVLGMAISGGWMMALLGFGGSVPSWFYWFTAGSLVMQACLTMSALIAEYQKLTKVARILLGGAAALAIAELCTQAIVDTAALMSIGIG
jgi:RHS repeat-associated protein